MFQASANRKVFKMVLVALEDGAGVNVSGAWFDAISYGVNKNGFIDYDEVEKLAKFNKPKMINAAACASGDEFIAEMRRDFGGRIVG